MTDQVVSKFIDTNDALASLSDSPQITILWDLGCHQGTPTGGLCEFDSGNGVMKKALFMTVIMDSYENSRFMIYTLPDESAKIMENDHERFRQEVGNYRDYHEPERKCSHGKQGQVVTFGYSFRLEELPVDEFIGLISYQQVHNPYPKFYCTVNTSL